MRRKLTERDWLERELSRAKKKLFKAATIKELKFLQEKIRYLNDRLREMGEKR